MKTAEVFYLVIKSYDDVEGFFFNSKADAIKMAKQKVPSYTFNMDGIDQYGGEEIDDSFVYSGSVKGEGFLFYQEDGLPNIDAYNNAAAQIAVGSRFRGAAGAFFPSVLGRRGAKCYIGADIDAEGALWTFQDGNIEGDTSNTDSDSIPSIKGKPESVVYALTTYNEKGKLRARVNFFNDTAELSSKGAKFLGGPRSVLFSNSVGAIEELERTRKWQDFEYTWQMRLYSGETTATIKFGEISSGKKIPGFSVINDGKKVIIKEDSLENFQNQNWSGKAGAYYYGDLMQTGGMKEAFILLDNAEIYSTNFFNAAKPALAIVAGQQVFESASLPRQISESRSFKYVQTFESFSANLK